MKNQAALITIALVATGLSWSLFAADSQPKPKFTTKEIMKAINKGDDSICKKVTKGTASKEEIAKLVACYKELPLNEPPKGSAASWKEKSSALAKAAEALAKDEPGALEKFKQAVNCKACHSEHKPD
ncbi:MAG: hypothetical protein JNN07_00070 [Verrucomicrobiales bacterium]|nr:hypothetical protein [Verrucomicrobiales bacterium]